MMFDFADKDGDGRISWKEFQIMINPPKPPEPPKPSLLDLASMKKHVASIMIFTGLPYLLSKNLS